MTCQNRGTVNLDNASISVNCGKPLHPPPAVYLFLALTGGAAFLQGIREGMANR